MRCTTSCSVTITVCSDCVEHPQATSNAFTSARLVPIFDTQNPGIYLEIFFTPQIFETLSKSTFDSCGYHVLVCLAKHPRVFARQQPTCVENHPAITALSNIIVSTNYDTTRQMLHKECFPALIVENYKAFHLSMQIVFIL